MKEIKFKGKDSRSGEWYYGNFYDCDTKGNTHICTLESGSLVIDRQTVGQYIGKRDKRGREIYEGDIVRGDDYPFHDDGADNYYGVVFWNDEECMHEVMQLASKQTERRGISNFINIALYDINTEHIEVVGNIFDRPGLFRDSDEDVIRWFLT